MLLAEVLLYSFIFIIVVQLVYYGFIFGRLATFKPKSPTQKNIGVSVLLCAKNEAENLKVNLPNIIDQDYPEFEIVLINDNSSDETLSVMKSFASKSDRIKLVDVKPIEKFWGNKKYALTLGIKAATYDYLLFTDADCQPESKHWITEMSRHFSNKKSLVLGYSPYRKIKKSFLNLLVRYETFLTAVQYFSYALLGIPYMAVGRNLAYKKGLFFEANGYMNHMEVKSGDDDLFVNQVGNKENIELCISKSSFVHSEPKTSFKDWILQKRRHISTAKYYKPHHKLLLGLFYLSQIGFWNLAIVLISMMFKWELVLGLILLRFVVQYISLIACSKKLDDVNLMFWLPVLEFLLILIQFFIFIKNLISKPQHWK